MRRIEFCLAGACFLALLLAAPAAVAFQIETGFSDPCHELLTLSAAKQSFADEFAVGTEVPMPTDEDWEEIAQTLIEDLGITYSSDRERFLLVSLVVGTRWPDTQGNALTDSSTARRAHVDTDDQYNHSLRRASDDFEKGNLSAVRGARETILFHLDEASRYLALPPDQQLLERSVVVDYYGDIEIQVWAPAFHVGFAAHTLQDSFSHTIRTDDLTTVLHVMNFTEATRGEHELIRDGLPHSGAMDDCEVRASEIAEAAHRATVALYAAYFAMEFEGVGGAVERVLDDWLSYQPGCTPENDFCDSRWLDIAEEDPAQPILASVVGCQTTDSRSFGLWALVLVLCAWWFRRRSRRHRRGSQAGPTPTPT